MSKMKEIDNVSKEFWDDVVAKSNHATFFHTYTWAKIISDTFPEYSISTKGFVFDDGTKAVLPLLSTRMGLKGFFRSYRSMAPEIYGGIVTNGRLLTDDEICNIFKPLQKIGTTSVFIVGNPFYKYEVPEYYNKESMFTQVLDLRKGFDDIWSGYSKGHKSSTKKAEKMGVEIDLAQGLDDYKAYYIVYEDSLRRWGNEASICYPFTLFHNIFKMNSPNIKLWIARVDGKIIAGALLFYCNKHIAYWHGASLEDYFDYCPNNLLQTKIIQTACDEGYWYYDFNPSGGHEGVVRFKKSFGTERLNFSAYKWTANSLFYKIYQKFRNYS